MDNPLLHIIKVGGAIFQDTLKETEFLKGFHLLPSPKILVHGGGNQANVWLEKLNIIPKKIEGRRVTDIDTMEVVTMIYAGLNKQIVAKLNGLGGRTIGICGADASTVTAEKRKPKPVDYGFAGDIVDVNISSISNLISAGYDMVVAPLTFDKNGSLLNTNADTIATELAVHLSKRFNITLRFISDTPGVLLDIKDPSSLIPILNKTQYDQLTMSGAISDGMIPKLDNAFNGLQRGIRSITLSNKIETESFGTKIEL